MKILVQSNLDYLSESLVFHTKFSGFTLACTHTIIFLSLLSCIIVNSPQGERVCCAIILQITDDLPACSHLANMEQFNGQYGCLFCEYPADTLPTDYLH